MAPSLNIFKELPIFEPSNPRTVKTVPRKVKTEIEVSEAVYDLPVPQAPKAGYSEIIGIAPPPNVPPNGINLESFCDVFIISSIVLKYFLKWLCR
jgi:hypothetical protein